MIEDASTTLLLKIFRAPDHQVSLKDCTAAALDPLFFAGRVAIRHIGEGNFVGLTRAGIKAAEAHLAAPPETPVPVVEAHVEALPDDDV